MKWGTLHNHLLVAALLVLAGLALGCAAWAQPTAWAQPALVGQGGAVVSVDENQITVEVTGIPGHQVRVELSDDTIAGTGLLTEAGTTTIVLELPPGDEELEVITFDPVGIPTTVGTYPVSVAPPPPDPPQVEVRAGTAEDNRSLLVVTGGAGLDYRADIAREGNTVESASGTLDEAGRAEVPLLLAPGPWGYVVTQRNESGDSEAALGTFEVTFGAPPPPVLSLTSGTGRNPVTVDITGPRNGTVRLVAEGPGDTLEEEVELDQEGLGDVELRFREDGDWSLRATATDIGEQTSAETTLVVTVDGQGPPLDAVALDSAKGEFAFRIVTEVGVAVTITSETEALNQEFVAEEEETDFRVEVPEGEHVIEVRALDETGNESFDLLSSEDSPSGGFPWTTFFILVGVIAAAFVAFGFHQRQVIIDWWNGRRYR